MAQGPFQRAIQRIANALGVLLPAQRAVRFMAPFTTADVPETQAGSTLRGASGDGEVTGYTQIGLDTSLLPGVVTSRLMIGTHPIRINGGASADLGATNITTTIEPATTLAPGSMSAADKALLAAATVAPTPNTLLLRGPSGEGKCTSFEASSGGEFRANIGGDPVIVATVDGSKNVTYGDTLQTNSLQFLVTPNGNMSALVQGTGTWLAAAVGATSKLSWASNGFENMHAEGGLFRVASSGLFTAESTIGNFTFTASGATILSVTKAPIDPAPLATAVLASDGDISLNGIHALTLNGGTGGTQSRLEVSDAGHVSAQINAAEVARFDATGLVFHKDATWGVTQPQSTSGAGRTFTWQGQKGAAGTDGANVITGPGDAGTAATNLQGNYLVDLGPRGAGEESGNFELWAGGAFNILDPGLGRFFSMQYGLALGAVEVIFDQPYEETVNGYLSIRSLTASVTINAQTDLALGASDDVTITCGAAKLIVFKVNATEVARFDAGGPPAPQSVGAANSVGTGTELALASHVHAHAWNREFGSNTLTGTTTTRYLASAYHSATPPSDPLDMDVREPFKARSIGVKARLGGTAGATISGKIRKNGSAVGAAVLTVASDATTGSASFTPVSFVAGDTWGFQVDKSAAIATSPTDIIWTVGCTP